MALRLFSSVINGKCRMSPKGVATEVHNCQDCVCTSKYNIITLAIGFGNHHKFQVAVQEASFTICFNQDGEVHNCF